MSPIDLGLRKIHLLDGRRHGADMDDAGAPLRHEEGRLFDGIVADGDDEVGLVDRLVDPIAFASAAVPI